MKSILVIDSEFTEKVNSFNDRILSIQKLADSVKKLDLDYSYKLLDYSWSLMGDLVNYLTQYNSYVNTIRLSLRKKVSM